MTEESGYCHLCGKIRILTKEHVPPKSAFNQGPYKVVDLREYARKPLGAPVEGDDSFGGIGYKTLCQRCNQQRTGSIYGEAYKHWAEVGASLIDQIESRGGIPAPNQYAHVGFLEMYPARILKQIISNFLAINSIGFRQTPLGESLAAYVLQRRSQEFPSSVRVFAYLNWRGDIRRLPKMTRFTGSVESKTVMSEITRPPFGYLLLLEGERPDERLAEITGFSRYRFDQKHDIKMGLAILETQDALIPGDYRTREEVVAQQQRDSKRIKEREWQRVVNATEADRTEWTRELARELMNVKYEWLGRKF